MKSQDNTFFNQLPDSVPDRCMEQVRQISAKTGHRRF